MKRLILTGMLCCAGVIAAQADEFSKDSAYAFLRVLVRDIGPRPMGSPAEQSALRFAAAKFREYGCQEAYVMPMRDASGVNTTSGIAVGVLKGKTGRIILIGGHCDSAGPEVPGANDDGSGAASVIELARDLGRKEHESTVVFCCWGGEEEGLKGSEYFVQNFPRMDDIALMLQIDMADGSGELQADPDAEHQVSAPRWLVEAAFDIFYNDLHRDGLVYPTQAATINGTIGATGSDHIPFLRKGIPAIDFTTDVTYPIHTPLDNWSNFDPSGLPRTGDLVLKLFERFDGGVPSRDTEKYWLVVVGHTPLFFSHPVLRAFALAAVLVGAIVLVVVRRRRTPGDPERLVRWSGLKLVLFTLVIQACMWLSENVVGVIKGYRHVWVNNFGGFVVLGIFCGLLGLWVSLRSAKHLRLSGDPLPYYVRAFLMLLVLTALLSWPNAELGLYPALSIFFLALAMLVRPAVLKGVCTLLVPYPMVRLVFTEDLGLYQRMLAHAHMPNLIVSVLYNAAFVLFFSLLSLPFVFAFAAVYRDTKGDLFWLKKFSGTPGLVIASTGIVVMAFVLAFRPPYDNMWQMAVSVEQRYTLGSDSGSVNLSSGEYLRGLRIAYDGRDSTVHASVSDIALVTARPAVVPWLSVSNTSVPDTGSSDTLRRFTRSVALHSEFRPLAVTVTYTSAGPFTSHSSWVSGGRRTLTRETDRRRILSWYAFPDTLLTVPVTFAVRDTQKIRETIEVTYDSLAYPLALGKDMTYFIRRSVVTATSTFGAPAEGRSSGDAPARP